MALAPILDRNAQPVGSAEYSVTPPRPDEGATAAPADLFSRPGGGGLGGLASGGGLLGGGLNLRNLYQNVLRQGAGAGVFSPHYLRAALRAAALRRQRNAQANSGVLGRLLGLDPSQQRAHLAESGRMGQHDLSQGLQEADLTDLQQYRDLIMHVLGQEGQASEAAAARQAAKRAQGGIGGFLGSVAGRVLPSLIPGGSAVAGAVGGGNARQNQPDRYSY